MGGMCFIPASCMYFAQVSQNSLALTAGGWLFTIGSFCLLMADLQEWWYYRVGCILDCKYRRALQSSMYIQEEDPYPTLRHRCDRAKIGINTFTSVCGSALYLAGSILLIPGFEAYLVVSVALIIAGSSVIFLSQLAKVYRSGRIDDDDQLGGQFRFSNLSKNIPTVSADSSAAAGAIFFLIGSVLFLPQFNVNQIYQDKGSAYYVCGGVGFAVSAVFFFHEDFCRNRGITCSIENITSHYTN